MVLLSIQIFNMFSEISYLCQVKQILIQVWLNPFLIIPCASDIYIYPSASVWTITVTTSFERRVWTGRFVDNIGSMLTPKDETGVKPYESRNEGLKRDESKLLTEG